MRFLLPLLLAIALSGCTTRLNTIPQPDGSLTVHDRVEIILASDMDDESKVQLVMALLEREQQQGTNVLSAWQQVFAWLATGIAIAK